MISIHGIELFLLLIKHKTRFNNISSTFPKRLLRGKEHVKEEKLHLRLPFFTSRIKKEKNYRVQGASLLLELLQLKITIYNSRSSVPLHRSF